MSVIPIVQGANVQLACDNGHTSTLAASAVAAPIGPAAFTVLTLTCPTCHETSAHPITGGADQPSVQALFVAVATANGCPCGALTAGKPAALVRSHLRSHAQQLGAGFIA